MILSLNIYPLLLAGWSSNRKYALIGGLRGVSQTISYEIRLAFLTIGLFLELGELRLRTVVSGESRRVVWVFPLVLL